MQTCAGIARTVWDILTQKWLQRRLQSVAEVGDDVRGQTIIVTGPTSGIGKQVALQLARRGCCLVLACRSLEKGKALEKQLQSTRREVEGQLHIEVLELDVADLQSVRTFANDWLASGRPLHCLVNNAGIFGIGGRRLVTKDGFEAHLGTNYLGPFLLTMLLLPALRKAGSPENPSRVVLVSSIVHHCCAGFHRDDMNLEAGYSHLEAYGQSKLAQVTFATELRRRFLGDSRVAVFANHPGECSTDIIRSLPRFLQVLYRTLMPPFLLSAEKGSLSTLFCATSNPVKAGLQHTDPDACYVSCACALQQPSTAALDPEAAAWIWDWSSGAVSLPPDAQIQRP